ncbi:hypothetical protein Tco_1018710 [Tanacetum coccineum]|uniref:Uncharacterized protein n=1 Tax=Tanacetum coccineum TaxID=301880 RepID=A0ABQ5FWL2_9ASTR
MLGATGVQILENNLDNLHSLREEDGTSETMDPQDLLGSFLLADIDLIILGYDPLALVDSFTSVEDNIGLLETRFDEEAVFMFVFPDDMTDSVNLTLLSLFFGVTTTNFSLELLMLGVSCPIAQQSRGYRFHINLKHFWSNSVFGNNISQDDDKRLCLVDDLKEVQVHIQFKPIRTRSSLKSKITTSCSQDKVKKTSLPAQD